MVSSSPRPAILSKRWASADRASGFDSQAFSEIRLLSPETGEVEGRFPMAEGVLTSMAPLNPQVAGVDGFISLVALDRDSGETVIRKYAYNGDQVDWIAGVR